MRKSIITILLLLVGFAFAVGYTPPVPIMPPDVVPNAVAMNLQIVGGSVPVAGGNPCDAGVLDFNDFTEYTDGADVITRNSGTDIDVAAMKRDLSTYVYIDCGAGNTAFDGDFEIWVDVQVTVTDARGEASFFMLANAVDDAGSLQTADATYLDARYYDNDGTYEFVVDEIDAGEWNNDTYSGALSTWYYMKIKRDEGVGANGTLYMYVYSDEQDGTLVDTLTVTLNNKTDYRYLFFVSSWRHATYERPVTMDIANAEIK